MSAAKQAKSNPVVDATAGAIAGCAARFVVGPLDVIKIRFQVQLEPIAKRAAGLDPTSLASKYTGLRQALTTIVKEEGIQVVDPRLLCLTCAPPHVMQISVSAYAGPMAGHITGATPHSALHSGAVCDPAAGQVLCTTVWDIRCNGGQVTVLCEWSNGRSSSNHSCIPV